MQGELNFDYLLNPPFITRGSNCHAHTVDLRQRNLHPGDRQIKTVFRRVFEVRSFISWSPVYCWYDELRDSVRPDYYQTLDGVYMVGCFYGEPSGGLDFASHFFVRKLIGFRGGLSDWKWDFEFPRSVRKYSVCAVFPDDYVWSNEAICDPYNHAVSAVSVSRMAEFGVDMATLVERMTAPEFYVEDAFKIPSKT